MRSHSPTVLNRAGLMFPALLALVAGSALQLQQANLWETWVYLSFMPFAPVFACLLAIRLRAFIRFYEAWLLRLHGAPAVLLVAASAAAFGFGGVGLRSSVFLGDALNPALEGRDLVVTGVVAAMPQRNDAGLRFRLDVESAREGAVPVRLPPRIYLGWYRGLGSVPAPQLVDGDPDTMQSLQRQPGNLAAGERWQFTVRLKSPHGASNPHGFDYELWLWEQGLQGTGYVRASPKDAPPQRLGSTWQHPVEAARQNVRDAIFARVENPKLAGVIAALVVGDQNAIDRADWDVYRATGVAHLMSISGLHVTMFAWGAALLVGWIWRKSERLMLLCPGQTAGLIGGVLLAGAYALFSGWGVPAQRTVLMLAIVGLLRASGSRWPWTHVWMLACAAVVVADPWALMQAGFWLSFVAVGFLFAADSGAKEQANTGAIASFDKKMGQFPAGPPQGELAPSGGSAARVAASVGAALREQWMITVALTPLTLLLFGQVSVVGLVANVLAIPWVTLVVTPLAMAGIALAPLWDVAAWAVQALAWYLQVLVQLSFASISIAQAPLWAGAMGVIGGILLAMRLPWGLRALGVPLLLPVLLWQAPRPALGQFDLMAADIGQGNAVIVRTQSHSLVFDAGPRFSRESDAGHRVVVPLLRALDLKIDTLVLSHRDADHTGGAVAVLTMQPQAALLSSIEDEHELQSRRPATRCVAGQQWQWDGVAFEVLHPLAADYSQSAKPNAMSCVLKISATGMAGPSALLVGDIEQLQEARLLAAGAPLKATVLLVPHHGSKTSSSEAFLDAVQPRFALVQSGYRNRFGHPAPVVLQRYVERQISVVDSPHCGAASWSSAQPEAMVCHRTLVRRYWNHRPP